jgi:hypothetical protein
MSVSKVGRARRDGDWDTFPDVGGASQRCNRASFRIIARNLASRGEESVPENKAVFSPNANFTAKLTVIGGCKLH